MSRKYKSPALSSAEAALRRAAASEEERSASGTKSIRNHEELLGELNRLISQVLLELQSLQSCPSDEVEAGLDYYREVEKFETGLIKRALIFAGGNQARAAKLLGLNHTTLHAKIKRLKVGVEHAKLNSLNASEGDEPNEREHDTAVCADNYNDGYNSGDGWSRMPLQDESRSAERI